MTALFAIITFFFIFVVVYLTITTVLAVAAWWLKRCTSEESVGESVDEIDRRMDRIKDNLVTFLHSSCDSLIQWLHDLQNHKIYC